VRCYAAADGKKREKKGEGREARQTLSIEIGTPIMAARKKEEKKGGEPVRGRWCQEEGG